MKDVELSVDNILGEAWSYEAGRRLLPYDAFKWWGRRPALFIQALLLDALGYPPGKLKRYARQRLSHKASKVLNKLTVCDPMCGGGTTCIEALLLGAEKILCTDIDPSSILVVNATLKIMSRECEDILRGIREALASTLRKTRELWCLDEFCYVHTFLTRECDEDACVVPRWLGTYLRKSRTLKFAITEIGEIEAVESVGIDEKVEMPLKNLVEIGKGVYAYASEIYRIRSGGGIERKFVSLVKDVKAAEHLAESLKKSRNLLGATCTQIPELKETRRLRKAGVNCWEEIFTPRQLLTLKVFLEEAASINPDSLNVAAAIVGTSIRTLSLLAFYYQPYGKMNPGLVVKSYWLPKYPTELNPLAGDLNSMKTIGRGTLLTYIKKLGKTCETYKGQKLKMDSIEVKPGNAFEFDYGNCDVVILDPPYPGKIDYSSMTSIYSIPLSLVGREAKANQYDIGEGVIDVHDMNKYVDQLSKLLEKIVMELKNKGKTYVLISEDDNGRRVVEALKEHLMKLNLGLNIQEKGPFIGESPGKLGRSKTRRIVLLKIEKI